MTKQDPGKDNIHFIYGFHSVKEAMEAEGTRIHEIWVSENRASARTREIQGIARSRGIPVFLKERYILNHILPGKTHQGFVALAKGFTYTDLDDIIEKSLTPGGRGLLITADHITDEGNLGALIRTSVFFGAHGLIIPKDRSARITHNVMKRSSGAYARLPVAVVVNTARTLDELNKRGFWVVGAAGESPGSIYDFDWHRDIVLVLGSEDKGLSKTIRKKCHQLVGIPGTGGFSALNVSVACGVILAEIVRQRESL